MQQRHQTTDLSVGQERRRTTTEVELSDVSSD
ncbi:Uncharacterised protein [Vibrio cholerae]|nr:Uncharacterised protein [Vibrio cholerae]